MSKKKASRSQLFDATLARTPAGERHLM